MGRLPRHPSRAARHRRSIRRDAVAAGGYSASKAALWSATHTIRLELAPQGTHVLGLHLGYADTPMTADYDVDKADPGDIVAVADAGRIVCDHEVLADDYSRQTKNNLARPITLMYPQLETVTPAA